MLKMNEEIHDSDKFVSNIKTVSNHIYFYDNIDDRTAIELNSILYNMSIHMTAGMAGDLGVLKQPAPIYLHINSSGGDVFSSLAIADTIENLKQTIPVVTIVEGLAASGASIISICGTVRLIRKHAFMLIHELSTHIDGKHSVLKDDIQNNEEIMKQMKSLYESKSKIPKDKLEGILKRDVMWNATTCKKYGLVDEIC